ncbi:MAG TPA: TonB-dependent receptor plug domain-containing protein [Edaphocola sp.]|nr:TonB-dependent receptor plug domain-containing protein [Edaphocola sp.]
MKPKIYSFLLFSALLAGALSAFGQQQSAGIVPDSVKNAKVAPGVPVQSARENNALPVVTDFAAILDGTVPGVEVTNGSGQPGATGDIRIRGTHDFRGGGGAPMIVLDSMPYYGNLNDINLHDIASVNVLKDGHAAALYGFAALNGVICINAKKSVQGKFHLNLDAGLGMTTRAFAGYETIQNDKDFYEVSWNQLRNYYYGNGYDLQASAQMASDNFIGLIVGQGYNAYNVPDKELIDPGTGKLNPNAQLRYPAEDWRKAMQQTALRHDYHLSGSQRTEKGSYYFGLGYLNDGGFVQHTGFERFSARFKGTYKPFKWLEAGLQVACDKSTQKMPVYGDETFYDANITPSVYPVFYRDANGHKVKDGDGHYIYDLGNGINPGESMGYRPVLPNDNLTQDLKASTHYFDNKGLWAMPFLSLKFLNHFRFDVQMNYHFSEEDEIIKNSSPVFSMSSTDFNTKMKDKDWRSALSWSQVFGRHHLSVSAGYEHLHRTVDYWRKTDNKITMTGINWMSTVSYFAGLSDNFRGKYSVYGIFRRDRTDILPPGNRDIDNWVAGAAWHIQKETFLRDVTFLSNWTISASYGQSGHKKAGFFMAVPSEKCSNLDIATELGFINNRIDLTAHYFIRNDENLGYYVSSPPSTGLPPFFYYDGIALRTKGLELGLSATPIKKQDFSWDIALNLSHYKGVVQSMGKLGSKIYQNQMILEEGQAVNTFYLPRSAGVDPVNGDELYAYTGPNGAAMTTNDYNLADVYGSQHLGTAAPDWFGGLGNSFRYRHCELYFQLTFGLGGKIYDGAYQALMASSELGQNYSTDMVNAWTPGNRNTDIPRLDIGSSSIAQPSSRFISSARYLNVHQLSLSYDFSDADSGYLFQQIT